MTTPSSATTTSHAPKVDYVIVIDYPSTITRQEAREIQEEYSNLIGVLKTSGLQATGRKGIKGSNQLLVFVKASEERLQHDLHRESLSDWLHGVSSTSPSPKTPRDFAKEPIKQSERLRLVHSILTSPRTGSSTSVTSSAASGEVVGLVLPSPRFPHVTSLFPPHDPAFNKLWIDRWSSRSHATGIPSSELIELKDHFGTQIALYFAFLRYYFRSLVFPASIGLLFWFVGYNFSAVYGFGIVAYSVVFIESWRLKEREYAVEWRVFGCEKVESQRREFWGTDKEEDPVTGLESPWFPWYRTLARQLGSVPILLVFAGVLATLITGIYTLETLIGEVYDGPGKRFLTLVPTLLFVGVVPQVTALWQTTAERLTNWENHPRPSGHTNSLTLKVFALNFFVAYGSLLLTSYIYIPFGSVLVPHILSLLPADKVPRKPDFSFAINSSKLHTQIVAYTLTNQIVGAFTEIGVPAIMKILNTQVLPKVMGGGVGKDEKIQDEEDEKVFLERIRNEAALPTYDTYLDYLEMTLQFGYMTMFSVIWPIAPLWSLVNNFFELRSDAYKITHQHRRPIPVRQASIGPWLEVLGFISWVAAFTNASLVYLYRPHISHPSKTSHLLSDMTGRNVTLPTNGTIFQTSNMHTAQHATTLTDPSGISSIRSTLFAAALVALASEHGYLLARAAIRYILTRIAWDNSTSEIQIRRGNHELKKSYLEQMELKAGPRELAKRSGKEMEAKEFDKKEEMESFWKREDKGMAELRKFDKTE